jgi:preprotein translocase subunit SecA
MVDIARDSLDAEEQHVLHTAAFLADLTRDRMDEQLSERLESVETYFQGLSLEGETGERQPRQILEELSSLARVPIRLNSQELRELRDDPDSMLDAVEEQIEESVYTQSTTRLVGAIERRLEEPLGLDTNKLAAEDWDTITDGVLDAIQNLFDRRRQRLIGENGDGQITKDLKSSLGKSSDPLNEGQVANLLMQMRQGARATFDKRTHRRVWERTTRLTFVYAAAQALDNREPEEITNEVLEHLEGAQVAMRMAWGQAEWNRLGNTRPADLDDSISQGLRKTLGDSQYPAVENQPLHMIQGETRVQVIKELGRQSLTEIYRQLLLSVISELWVEYLTSMEALRVSIGLEAYAQRDPLVQYKNKAFEMFQELLDNMRLAVVNRMFTFRPRELSRTSTGQTHARKTDERPKEAAEKSVVEEAQAPYDEQADEQGIPLETSETPSETSQSQATPDSTLPVIAGDATIKASKSKKRRRRRRKKK